MSGPTSTLAGGTWDLGGVTVPRLGYGAMQLAGPGVLGPPADHAGAVRVLRAAVEAGSRHVDTSGAYGPGVTNKLLREALDPSGTSLVVATKVGATRDARAAGPSPGVHAGWGRPVWCVGRAEQHHARPGGRGTGARARHVRPEPRPRPPRGRRPGRRVADAGVAFVPFFPPGGFSPLQAEALSVVAHRHATAPTGIALAWLLQRSPDVLLIPGTSSTAHLLANVRGAGTELTHEDLVELDAMAGVSRAA